MLTRSLKLSSRTLSKSTKSALFPQTAYAFSQSWKPKVPKHEIHLDKSTYRLAHPIWDLKAAETVELTHRKPQGPRDYIALYMIKTMRTLFDFFSGYKPGKADASAYLTRCIFLETVAGVPGMIGGMVRHTRSIGTFQPDGGWIHHLIEEAENERMHLFAFLQMKQPGFLFKAMILAGQAVFVMAYTTFYVLSPRTAHRFVGYLEEEAVWTYTHCLHDMQQPGSLYNWNTEKAPETAVHYWNLNPNSTVRDMIVTIRADEMMHREVNHRFADLNSDQPMDHMEIIVKEAVEKVNKEESAQSASSAS